MQVLIEVKNPRSSPWGFLPDLAKMFPKTRTNPSEIQNVPFSNGEPGGKKRGSRAMHSSSLAE